MNLKNLIKHQNTSILGLISLSLLILLLPGQNQIQTTTINPSQQNVLGVSSLDFPKSDIPKLQENSPILEISAKSAIAIDIDSAVVLFQKNPDSKLPPASTTKIMTALIALQEYQPDEIVEIVNENFSIGSKSHILPGEKLTVESLLYALLVSSGNDAALALAQHHPQGYSHFISLMNQKARELHLINSRFSNVSGVEQSTHYSSARDLALLTKEAIKNQIFKDIVSQKNFTISSLDGSISHNLENTNELLGNLDGVIGVKTGWTYLAGECLVTYVDRNQREIITVVLGSLDRFGESTELINWIYQNYNWAPFPITD